jgi:hypothetical protein
MICGVVETSISGCGVCTACSVRIAHYTCSIKGAFVGVKNFDVIKNARYNNKNYSHILCSIPLFSFSKIVPFMS